MILNFIFFNDISTETTARILIKYGPKHYLVKDSPNDGAPKGWGVSKGRIHDTVKDLLNQQVK